MVMLLDLEGMHGLGVGSGVWGLHHITSNPAASSAALLFMGLFAGFGSCYLPTVRPTTCAVLLCCCLFAYGVGSFCHSVAVCFGNAVLARGCIFDMLPIESAGISKCFALGMFTTCICVLYSIRPACCMLPHGL